MGEGEHTIIGKIPRERLNQIASRKLSALGVPVRLGADRETLEGELAFQGRLLHPATGVRQQHPDPQPGLQRHLSEQGTRSSER